jgi:hypothetical protein
VGSEGRTGSTRVRYDITRHQERVGTMGGGPADGAASHHIALPRRTHEASGTGNVPTPSEIL